MDTFLLHSVLLTAVLPSLAKAQPAAGWANWPMLSSKSSRVVGAQGDADDLVPGGGQQGVGGQEERWSGQLGCVSFSR